MRWLLLTLIIVSISTLTTPIVAVVVSGQDEDVLVFNQTGTYVYVSPWKLSVKSYGVVINAYYNSSSTVVLIARPYINVTPFNVTFELWDYWSGTKIGEYNVSTDIGYLVVDVPSNVTIFYYTIKGDKYGPYYIVWHKPVTTSPFTRLFNILVLVAILGALGARGNLRDIGLGLIAYAIVAGIVAMVFGITDPVVSGIYIVAFIMGLFALGGELLKRS